MTAIVASFTLSKAAMSASAMGVVVTAAPDQTSAGCEADADGVGAAAGAYSGPIRPLIPFQFGRPFRFIPA
ncbi:MAG: hypothetical protein WCP98_19890, partial [Actinomycetes bacterium]